MSSISVIRPHKDKKEAKKKSPKPSEKRKKKSRSSSSSSSSSSSRSRSRSRSRKSKDRRRSRDKRSKDRGRENGSSGTSSSSTVSSSSSGVETGKMEIDPSRTAQMGAALERASTLNESGFLPSHLSNIPVVNHFYDLNPDLSKHAHQVGATDGSSLNYPSYSGDSTLPLPSLEAPTSTSTEAPVIFHPETSTGEVITVDGMDQKDERKSRDRERRRHRDRDRRSRDRSRDRDRDRRRGYGGSNWDKTSGGRESRSGRSGSSRDDRFRRDKDRESDQPKKENWAEFQRRQKDRMNQTRTVRRTKDPNRDTSYDYLVPQNYLYDDRSYQDYEASKRRNTSARRVNNDNGGNSPDLWSHDKFDPNEAEREPDDSETNFDRWALTDS